MSTPINIPNITIKTQNIVLSICNKNNCSVC